MAFGDGRVAPVPEGAHGVPMMLEPHVSGPPGIFAV